MNKAVCTLLLLLAAALASSTVNASLIGASVAADLDGESRPAMVIDSGVEFSFLAGADVLARSADFDDISVTLRYANLSSTDPANFGSSFWTFIFTDWPGVPQMITDVIADLTNPSGAVIEAIDDDLIAISLPELGVQPGSDVEWRFEIVTSNVPVPATILMIGLGMFGIGIHRLIPRASTSF